LLSGCKSQYPAVYVTINGAYRIPQDVDGLLLAIYDDATNDLIISKTYALQPGTNFPFTVTLVDSGASYSTIKVIANATLTGSNQPVATGEADQISLESGGTVEASIDLMSE